ncbi:MAG TPA: phosphopantothenate--cysteine ligase [Phycisphaerales bacterium]|nr:phosphopantothenate--cysteine ligase [Phycisphaerales bacterium]
MKSNRLHFLITAGGTREYIDPVRFITNASSGKMGFALASAALKVGHKVTLITTVKNIEQKTQNSEVKEVYVETAGEMFEAVKKYFPKCDCLIMAAAVSDYTPVKVSKIKIKKSKSDLVIKLKPTTDILKWAGEHKKKNQTVVGFALEDRNLLKNAEKKLQSKNLDMVIANEPSAIGSEKSIIHVKRKNSDWQKFPKADKSFLAKRIVNLLS